MTSLAILIERTIKEHNYDSVQDMRNKLDAFLLVQPQRITIQEYEYLNSLLPNE